MFESTLPVGVPDLMRVSAFRRYLEETGRGDLDAASTRLSTLSPSLLLDLKRFEQGGRHTELLEVVAACVRHSRSLTIHLECDRRVLPLTVYPVERMAHCPVALAQLLQMRLNDFVVLRVEPATLRPPDPADPAMTSEIYQLFAPLGALTWELALRGSRGELLPEISPRAAYRIPPGVDLRGMELVGSLAAAVHRMKRQTTNLREMSNWTGFDRERATRLLNALYLQAGLMISRTHPAATNEGWMP
jgi:hypothetical protein